MTDDSTINEMTGDAPDEVNGSPPAPPHRGAPPWLSSTLVGIATLVAVVSVFSTWVRVQSLDTEAWVELSDQLLEEPQVQDALSAYLTDQLFQQADAITAEIEAALPPDLKGLAGPLTSALRAPAGTVIDQLVSSQRFREGWSRANRASHQQLVSILRDQTGPLVSTANGAVTLDLGELVRQVGDALGLSSDVVGSLPQDAGVVTLFESEQLKTAQTAVQVLDFLSWFLLLVVVALYAAAVYYARDRRLNVLRNVGFSLIGAGVFVLALRAVAVRAVLDAIISNPGNRSFANVSAYVATGLIGQMAWSGIVYGVLIAGFATLLGTRSQARAARRYLAPALNASGGSVAAGTVGIVVLLLWWSPGRAFEDWVGGLTLIALIVGAVVALRRATLREFPVIALFEPVD